MLINRLKELGFKKKERKKTIDSAMLNNVILTNPR